jgi:RNA polymerase sigma-70 factor (ECF subfamily)
MTTAPDLPLPAVAAPPRPPLALVPAAPDAAEITDFDDALRRATPRLHRYAVRRLLDQHEAEEVVQEAMLRAFQHREALRTEDDLMAWLTVVTGRLAIDRLRVRGRSTPVAELPPGSRTGRDTADVVVARDEARIALDALEAMPTRQAAVLWAREVEGLSYDDIGERYGLSEPTVRSLLHRARRTLRREYEQRGGSLPTMGLIVALAPWLRALHVAGKLRHVAKRTTGAAALTATTIAVATIAPLWSHPSPAPAAAAPLTHPLVIKAETKPVDLQPHHASPAHPAGAPAQVTPTSTDVAGRALRALPKACTADGIGAGCQATPTTSTLYLRAGGKDVGVSTSVLPVDCTSLPATPVTHCEPSDRKS